MAPMSDYAAEPHEPDWESIDPSELSAESLLLYMERIGGLRGRKELVAKIAGRINRVRGDLYVKLQQLFRSRLRESPGSKPGYIHKAMKSVRRNKRKNA